MSQRERPPLNDSGWEIPSYEPAIYGDKQCRYALVIPVINEGGRIRGQLRRIHQAGYSVDVIVADGGSTDGSLDPEFVQSTGVRAVLSKTGPGKLSAQLRMAYAWCLRQGYDAIVTMDGNGKDGVEAIAAMVEKLDQGCDYVQGSRYLPGGVAENTPFERTVANRFIHAPLLSLAGKHIFTDTTNGFRAYSARYLLDPQVRPFRDEFQVYGLLFYLTVRAGQLGYTVDHVPVARRYPDSGKVPTKIGGFGSKLALLGETVFAATGGYTPDAAASKNPSMLWPLIAILLVTLPLFLSLVVAPGYSPDSWAFYELSKTIGDDFYRFTHFRSYASDIPYSSAFPPLYPTLIASLDGAFGTGARTGLYLAFGAFVGFACLSEWIGRRVTGTAWLGTSAALLLLLGPNMLLTELSAGRTIPLQLSLYALILLVLCSGERLRLASAVGIGFVAGLAVLNRFDAILLPIMSAILIGWLSRRPLWAAASLAASTLALLPWLVYSLATFGVAFATDNAGIATTIDPDAFVTDWWPVAQPTLFDDFPAWLARIASNIGSFLFVAASLTLTPLVLVFALAVAIVVGLQYVASRGLPTTLAPTSHTPRLTPIFLFGVMVAALLAPQIVTGYVDYRYLTTLIWIGFLSVGAFVVLQGHTQTQRQTFSRIIALFVALATLPFAALQFVGALQAGQLSSNNWEQFEQPQRLQVLQQCVSDKPSARILVIGDNNFAAKAGALGGLSTMMEPRNMQDGRLDRDGVRQFLVQWDVSFVLIADQPDQRNVVNVLDLKAVRDCPMELFEVVT